MNHNHKNCLKKKTLTSSPTSWNWNFLSNNNVVIPIVIASLSLLPSLSSPSSIYNHTWAYIWLVDCCLLMAMLQHAWVRGGDYDDYGSNTVYSRCPRFQKSNGYLNLSKFEFVKWRWASHQSSNWQECLRTPEAPFAISLPTNLSSNLTYSIYVGEM